jgi:hypothetical protein
MAEGSGFSFSSVILSYLMIAGGVGAASLGAASLHVEGQLLLHASFAAGGFGGGFFAARASRGSTVLEPVLGACLFVATLAALVMSTTVGRMLWSFGQAEMTRTALTVSGCALAGALLGAWISERALGDSTRSAIPWVLYVAIAVGGACLIAFMAAAALRMGGVEPADLGALAADDRVMHATILVGIGVGCLLAGLVAGASARTRILFAAWLGAGGAIFGFFQLAGRIAGSTVDGDALLGAAFIAACGGLLALLAAAIGWAVAGTRHASS